MIKINIVPNTVQRLTMSDEEYFGSGLPNYISNSKLGLINPSEGGSARKYSFGFNDEAKTSSAFELGSAVHAMILEKDMYNLSEVTKPTGMVGPIFDSVYKMMNRGDDSLDFDTALTAAVQYHNYYKGKVDGKRKESLIAAGKPYLEFLTEFNVPGTICLTEDMRGKLLECVKSVEANAQATKLLNPPSDEFFPIESFNEDVIICDADVEYIDDNLETISETVSLKAKIDNWSIDEDNKVVTLNDLKTTSKGVQNFPGKYVKEYSKINGKIEEISTFVKGSFQTYHYYRQMYMYGLMLWQYVTEKYNIDEEWTLKINMIAVETCKPHNTQVFEVSQDWIDAGELEFRTLMSRVVWHNRHGYDKLMEFDRNNIFVIE